MATKTSINSYVKNATKSVAYITVEALKEVNPVISDFAETNADAVKEIYQLARNHKKVIRSGKEALADNEYMKIAKETASNFMDDLRTGKFYNVDREKATDQTLFEGFGMGDFDFDDSDFNWDEDEDDELTTSSMDKIGEKISQSTGKAAIASADYIVKSSRADSKANRAHNDILFGQLNTGLVAINTTIAALGKDLLPSATGHFENSSKFYEFMTQETAKQTAYLEKIYNIMEDRFVPKEKSYKKKANPWYDIFGNGDSLDLAEYGKYIKNNVKDTMSLFTTMASMFEALDDTAGKGAGLRKTLASPVALVMQMGLASLLNKGRLGKGFEKLNNAIAGSFASIPGYISKKAKSGGMVWDFLGEILGVNAKDRRGIDTSKYEKGRVDWTGKDAKALRDVIPTQLALILSALTGKEAKVYDYESGKWKNYSGIVKEHVRSLREVAYDSQSDIVNILNKHFVNDAEAGNADRGFTKQFTNVRQSRMYQTWTDDLISFYNYCRVNGITIPSTKAGWAELKTKMKPVMAKGNKGGIISERNFDRIAAYYQKMINDKDVGLGTLSSANAKLRMSTLKKNAILDDIEQDQSSVFAQIYNGSGLSGSIMKPTSVNFLMNSIDNKGHNIFYYLQHYYVKMNQMVEQLGAKRSLRRSNRRAVSQVQDIPVNQNNLNRAREFKPQGPRYLALRYDADDEGAGDIVKPKEEKEKNFAERNSEKIKKAINENTFMQKVNKIIKSMGELFGKPMNGFESIVDTVDRNLYEFFYGRLDDHDRKHKSFIEQFYRGFESFFDQLQDGVKTLFRDHINPTIGIFADKFSNLFGYSDFGKMKDAIKNSKFVQNTKAELNKAFGWTKNAVSSTFGEVKNIVVGKDKKKDKKAEDTKLEEAKAARGGIVTKSGMVSVSEGEIILPNRSPFANPYEMDRIEDRNAKNYLTAGGHNFWGKFRKGGKVKKAVDEAKDKKKVTDKEFVERFKAWIDREGPDDLDSDEYLKFMGLDNHDEFIEEDIKNFSKTASKKEKIALNLRKKGKSSKTIDKYADKAEKKIKNIKTRRIVKETAKKAADEVSDQVVNGSASILHRLFGNLADKDGESKIKKSIKDWASDMKDYLPTIAAGGLIGGGVSMVGGLVGGPLLGVALGAATGYAMKSEKMQKFLFGNKLDDGNYTGGLFGPRLSKTINNALPDLGKFGVTGGIAGLLGVVPGGVLGGVTIGAGLGILSKSEDIRNYLFGNEGLLGKGTDEKIKKALPQMGIGAAALAFTGPFGLVGNMILGSAIGFASQTEKFKELIFGVEDDNGELQGGILGSIRKRIIDPLREYFKGGAKKLEDKIIDAIVKPIGKLFKPLNDAFKSMINGVGDYIKDKFESIVMVPLANTIDRYIINPLSKIVGGIGKRVLGAGNKVIGFVGNRLTNIGNRVAEKNIRRGVATSMTRQERSAMQEKIGSKYEFADYDKASSNMTTKQLQKHYNNLKKYRDLVKKDQADQKDIQGDIIKRSLADAQLNSTARENKKLVKLANNGDFNGVEDWIRNQGRKGNIDSKLVEKAVKNLRKSEKEYNKITGNKHKKEQKAAEKSMEALGVTDDMMFGKSSRKFFRLMDSDLFKDSVGEKTSKKEYKKLQEEAAAQKKPIRTRVEIAVDNIKSTAYQMRNALFELVGWKQPKKEKGEPQQEKPKEKDTKNNSVTNAVNEQAGQLDNKAPIGSTQTIVTEHGPKEYTQTADGLEPNLRDSTTKETVEKEEEDRKQKSKFFEKMSSFFGSFGLFGKGKKKDKEKEDEDKKEKTSIFSKIKNLFSGKAIGGFAGKLLLGLTAAAGIGQGYNFIKSKLGQKEGSEDIYSTIDKTGTKIQNAISNGIASIPGMIQTAIQGAFTWVGKNANNIFNWYIDGLKASAGMVTSAITWVVAKLPSLLWAFGKNVIWPAIKGVGQGIASWFKDDVPDLKDSASFKSFDSTNPFTKIISDGNKAASNLGLGKSPEVKIDNSFVNSPIDFGSGVSAERYKKKEELEEKLKNAKTDEERAAILKEIEKNAITGTVVGSDGQLINYHETSLMHKDELGNTITVDENGNIVNTNDNNRIDNGRYMKGFLNRLITGRNGGMGKLLSGAGKVISKFPGIGGFIGKPLTKFGGFITGRGLDASSKLVERMPSLQSLTNKTLADGIEGVANFLGNTKFASKHSGFKNVLEKISNSSIIQEGKKLAKERTEKAAKDVVENIVKEGAEQGAETVVENSAKKGIVKTVVEKVVKLITEKLPKLFSNFMFVGKIKESLKAYGKKATKEIAQETAEKAGQKLTKSLVRVVTENLQKASAKVIAKISAALASGGLISMAFAIGDFISGYNNAESILGVVEGTYTPGFFEKIIAGLIKAINGFILWGIIPESTLVDICISIFSPIFQVTSKELLEAREKSEQIVSEYNAETGTHHNVQSYNDKDKWTTKLKNEALSLFKQSEERTEKAWATMSSGSGRTASDYGSARIYGNNAFSSATGGGSHVSQFDPRYARRKFGKYTVAEKGCGPAVATSVLQRYGRDQSLNDSINYAEANGYVAGASGTKAGYFSDIFNANGIKSSYTTSQNRIRKNIKAGKPTVLLGQDGTNDSKFKSPFGPSPHYVVAQGMDKKGNVIVDDPELGSTALYKNKILNKAKLGVLTGGDSGINSDIDDMKASMRNKGLVNGKTADGNSIEAKVYQFFTQNGFTPASTAGIMGNIYQESKFDPAALQNGRGPAAGLFQWEGYTTNGGRWIELNKYAQSKGKHWTDLQSQLEYALKEMAETQKWMWTSGPANNKYASVSGLDEFKQMKDVSMATEAFENHFERAGTPMMDTRKQKAIEYYNKYSGATFTNPTTFGSTDFSNNSSSDSSSGGLDLGSIIGNFISGTLGKVFGAMGKFGEFLSGAFGITNSDNQTLSNGVSLNGGSLSSGSNILGSTGSVVSTTANKFPYYNQGDGQWANIQYGKSGTMKTSACGPTSMAMVLQSYGKHYTPVDAANYSVQKGHRVENQGTAWTFFKDIGNANGLDVNQFESANTAKQYLNQGIPVIGSMKPGDFTKSGHFIVFTGLDGNKLYVNDPASTERTGKIWNADNSLAQAKQFWSVSQNGQGSLGIKPGVNEFSAGNSGLPNERLKVIDFTKIYGGSSDISSAAVQNTAMKVDINDARKKNVSANAFGSSASTEITKAVKSGDLSQMIQVAIEYLKTIASNTAYNASLAQIVQLMTQLTQIVAATQSGSTNSSDDNMALRTQTEDILNKLNALATAV